MRATGRSIDKDNPSSAGDEGFMARMQSLIDRYKSVSAFARASGVSESAIRKWRNGLSEPTRDRLIAVATAAQVSVEWLATGKGLPSLEPEDHFPGEYQQIVPGSSSNRSLQRLSEDEFQIISSDEEDTLSRRQIVEIIVQSKSEFIERFFSEYAHLTADQYDDYCLYPVSGRGMEPTLLPGDFCILDETKSSLHHADEGIYVIKLNEVDIIRRIRRNLNNHIVLTIDNPDYRTSDTTIDLSKLPPNIRVVGRVVYIFRRVD